MSHDIRIVIREMSTANPLWGAPRITGSFKRWPIGEPVDRGEVNAATSSSTVTDVANVSHQSRDPDPAVDFFVVLTVTFRMLFVLVILAHARQRIVHVAVAEHPTAAWTAQQLRNAFPGHEAPACLLHDRDAVFAGVATTMARMHIQAVRTAPRSPWHNAYVERVIGSIRRECLDHVIVANEAGLRRVLSDYLTYYLHTRTHLALDKNPPVSRSTAPPSAGRVVATPGDGGLHHRYDRVAA